jgi:hypothetical protein
MASVVNAEIRSNDTQSTANHRQNTVESDPTVMIRESTARRTKPPGADCCYIHMTEVKI